MSKAKKQIEAALKRCQSRVRKLQAAKAKPKPSRPQAKKSKTKAPTRARAQSSDNLKLWIWKWKEGGFNSARVATRRDAIREAKRLGAPYKGAGLHTRGLTLDEASLHEGTWDELSGLYKATPLD